MAAARAHVYPRLARAHEPVGWARCLQITGSVGIDRGYAPVDLPHPLSAAAFGTDVVAQWLVFDPASQAYAATQMHAIRLP